MAEVRGHLKNRGVLRLKRNSAALVVSVRMSGIFIQVKLMIRTIDCMMVGSQTEGPIKSCVFFSSL